MKGYSDFFNNLELNKEDLKLFIENNELNQIKLFINSLKLGGILYDYEKTLRQLCKLPERKVQKGDINLKKRQDGIIQLGRTNGKCRKGRKNSYSWMGLCISCEKNQASYPDEDGNKNLYCSICAKEKGCYEKLNLCKNCKKLVASYPHEDGNKNKYCATCARLKECYQLRNSCKNCKKVAASYPDENGNKNIYCGTCAKKKGCYEKRNICKNCNEIQANFPDENGNKKQYCATCAKEKDCYEKQNLCKNCKKYQAHYHDEDGNLNLYCATCAKEKGCYHLRDPCKNCKKYQSSFPDENGKKFQYCSICAKEKGCHQIQNPCKNCKKFSSNFSDEDGNLYQYCSICAKEKGCYQLQNPCQECNEISGHIKCAHVVKNNDGTYTTTELNLCVSCAIKLKLYDPTKNRNKSEKRFRKEMRMFVKEQEENEYINLDFENTMFTNCIDNEEICRNKFSLRLDGLLQYRGIYWLLENDEHQHSDRGHYPLSCELDRMMKAINLIRLQGVIEPVVFIRFNPDTCHHNQETIRIPKTQRFKKLKELLRTYIPTKDFEIHYMYYDTLENNLELQSEPHWINTLKRFVRIHKGI